MSEAVREWFTAHHEIITDVSTAVFGVEIATRETFEKATKAQSLTAPTVRAAFRRIVAEARACRDVVDRALALPPIPDIDTDVQFRHTMQLQAKWTDTIADAATRVDPDTFDRAIKLQRQVAVEGALIMEELRKAWPDDDPTARKA